ncbi:MAG: SCO family protein [Candidatus Bipolaricaulia bacterium]
MVRRVATVLLLSALLTSPGVLGFAHGGADKVYEGTVSSYFVVAEAGLQGGDTPESADALDYTIYLRDAQDKRPIPEGEAEVHVVARTSRGSVSPQSTTRFTNMYSAHFPLETLGQWTMTVRINGELGEAEVTHTIDLDPGGGVPWLVVGYLGGILLLVLVGVVLAWRMMREVRRPSTSAVLIVGLLLGALTVLAGCGDGSSSGSAEDTAASDVKSYSGTELAGAAPDFTLTDQNGKKVSLSDFEGQYVVLTFLDPNCTDICPLTTLHFARTQAKLSKELAERVVYLAINVNAEYASVDRVAEASQTWRSAKLERWHFLTGDPDELRSVWKDYGVVVKPNPDKEGEVIHTPGVYLIGPDGKRRWYVSTPLSSAEWEALDLPLADLLAERIRGLSAY